MLKLVQMYYLVRYFKLKVLRMELQHLLKIYRFILNH